MQEYTSLWGDPARACFRDIVDNTTRLLESLLSEHFGQFSQLEVYIKWVPSSNYIALSPNASLSPGLWSLRIEINDKTMLTTCFKCFSDSRPILCLRKITKISKRWRNIGFRLFGARGRLKFQTYPAQPVNMAHPLCQTHLQSTIARCRPSPKN